MFTPAALIFSFLLTISGTAKLARPQDVERAIVALGIPRIPGLGRGLGFVEIFVGLASLFYPVALFAQGVLYLAFGVWVLVALRSDAPLSSCGCLGKDDTPPTAAHVALNLLAAVLSVGAAFGGPIEAVGPLAWVAVAVPVAAGVILSWVIINDAARLVGVRTR